MAFNIEPHLYPNGKPVSQSDIDKAFELYKIMVASSEALVARRQGVNTFFLTINGAILTAISLILVNGNQQRLEAAGMLVLTLTGGILAVAWKSLIVSFGQLNTGKFAVINKFEESFPAAIFMAEWKALGEGNQPKKYRTFTSREVWTPHAFLAVYILASILEALVVIGAWKP